jgi:hypothetical protein
MAHTVHKQVLTSTLLHKVTAFIIGYALWYTLSGTQTVQVTHTIPIAFYNVDGHQIKAPESVQVTISAKRMHMRTVSPEKLTLHIDAATLKQGENRIRLCDTSLFLPNNIDVFEYTPCPLIVHVYT